MFRSTRYLLNVARPLKASTGITGLEVHSNPLPALLEAYKSTESILSQIPQDSVYRQATANLIKYRKSVVEAANGDVAKVEKEFKAGQIEEVLDAAQDELKLAGKMLEWKPWEELALKAPEGQWAPIGSQE